MFTIEMLPATAGDCLLIRYGPDDAPRAVLVDGGRSVTYKDFLRETLLARLGDNPVLDLLVVTHIDNDHIFGAVAMLRENPLPVEIREVWFNGYRHLPETAIDALGPGQGDELTDLIVEHQLPWNALWDGHAVAIPSTQVVSTVTLDGGLRLTVLSPTPTGLRAVRKDWDAHIARMKAAKAEEDAPADALGPGIDPDPDPRRLAQERFNEDTSPPNASSIALLAEYEGKRLLLAGDAYPSVLEASLRAWGTVIGEERPRIDLVKLSHHGGAGNTSAGLLKAVDCERFLISSDGSGNSRHPSDVTVSRIITRPGTQALYFNYETPVSQRWGMPRRMTEFSYDAHFPETDKGGLLVEV